MCKFFNRIVPLFPTNFQREQWLLSMPDGSHIEVAFDQGVVIAGDQQSHAYL